VPRRKKICHREIAKQRKRVEKIYWISVRSQKKGLGQKCYVKGNQDSRFCSFQGRGNVPLIDDVAQDDRTTSASACVHSQIQSSI
jgi:hypothetical protein